MKLIFILHTSIPKRLMFIRVSCSISSCTSKAFPTSIFSIPSQQQVFFFPFSSLCPQKERQARVIFCFRIGKIVVWRARKIDGKIGFVCVGWASYWTFKHSSHWHLLYGKFSFQFVFLASRDMKIGNKSSAIGLRISGQLLFYLRKLSWNYFRPWLKCKKLCKIESMKFIEIRIFTQIWTIFVNIKQFLSLC